MVISSFDDILESGRYYLIKRWQETDLYLQDTYKDGEEKRSIVLPDKTLDIQKQYVKNTRH